MDKKMQKKMTDMPEKMPKSEAGKTHSDKKGEMPGMESMDMHMDGNHPMMKKCIMGEE